MMRVHQPNHSRKGSHLPCNKHSDRRNQEEEQDCLGEVEDQDCLVEVEDPDHLEEEEDLPLEDNPWPRNSQYLLQQM